MLLLKEFILILAQGVHFDPPHYDSSHSDPVLEHVPNAITSSDHIELVANASNSSAVPESITTKYKGLFDHLDEEHLDLLKKIFNKDVFSAEDFLKSDMEDFKNYIFKY
ncbi:hypothetical protein TSUD_104720 [Trifolium subterraneum]|uniref:Uncharacterized protein n=1 Tax=Trifolium subterraneum TaxID=3900 RepID=A0A2Z6MAV4_TRISU|nr:hypothetical protein TSUD_104720 [Trifolium subterraneum]